MSYVTSNKIKPSIIFDFDTTPIIYKKNKKLIQHIYKTESNLQNYPLSQITKSGVVYSHKNTNKTRGSKPLAIFEKCLFRYFFVSTQDLFFSKKTKPIESINTIEI